MIPLRRLRGGDFEGVRKPASFWRENTLDSPLYSTTCFSENVVVAETKLSYQNVRRFRFGLRRRLQRTHIL